MKKYIAPEVEIKKFNVENIMSGSSVDISTTDGTAATAANGSADVNYNELFGL